MSPALCQWSEVMNHPGLVCCVQQTTGIPLVIMVKPDTFLIQEIKTLPAKAKVRTYNLQTALNIVEKGRHLILLEDLCGGFKRHQQPEYLLVIIK